MEENGDMKNGDEINLEGGRYYDTLKNAIFVRIEKKWVKEY